MTECSNCIYSEVVWGDVGPDGKYESRTDKCTNPRHLELVQIGEHHVLAAGNCDGHWSQPEPHPETGHNTIGCDYGEDEW